MRVLLFRWSCDTGGVSTWMLLQQRGLAKHGVECEFWFCKPSNRVAEFHAAAPTTVAPLAALARRFNYGEFDIVHMTSSDPAATLVAAMARPRRVVVTSHGALADTWNSSNCFAYTAVSHGMADLNQPYTDLQIEVIRNSVDLNPLSPPTSRIGDRPIITFVGRTTSAQKDFPRLTRIAKHLVERGARVWIADPHETAWNQFQNLPISHVEVERWARVPYNEMPDFYRAVAASGGVVLMTSRFEGLPYVAAEAAACGAFTVAVDVVGLNESVLPGRTGVLFSPDASDEAVANLVFESMRQQPSPAACAEAARRFSPAAMADAYFAVYHRREQLFVSSRPSLANAHGTDELQAHLEHQRAWRADVCISATGGFAAAGQHALALTALRLAARAPPQRLLRPKALKQLALLALRIVHRPDRLWRQTRRAQPAATVPHSDG